MDQEIRHDGQQGWKVLVVVVVVFLVVGVGVFGCCVRQTSWFSTVHSLLIKGK